MVIQCCALAIFQRLFPISCCFWRPLPGRVRHSYGGGYTWHVERTGQEAPGARGAEAQSAGLTLHQAGDIVLVASP